MSQAPRGASHPGQAGCCNAAQACSGALVLQGFKHACDFFHFLQNFQVRSAPAFVNLVFSVLKIGSATRIDLSELPREQ